MDLDQDSLKALLSHYFLTREKYALLERLGAAIESKILGKSLTDQNLAADLALKKQLLGYDGSKAPKSVSEMLAQASGAASAGKVTGAAARALRMYIGR